MKEVRAVLFGKFCIEYGSVQFDRENIVRSLNRSGFFCIVRRQTMFGLPPFLRMTDMTANEVIVNHERNESS